MYNYTNIQAPYEDLGGLQIRDDLSDLTNIHLPLLPISDVASTFAFPLRQGRSPVVVLYEIDLDSQKSCLRF